jgi:6-phosphogluconolactonase/glucosamine-6-phosphate isomerase/deaminase
MLVVLKKDYEEVSREAARFVAGAVRSKPDIVLGLATGSTPLGLYNEWSRCIAPGRWIFLVPAVLISMNILALPTRHPQSFHHFMQENFFSKVNLPRERAHIPMEQLPATMTTIAPATNDPSRRPAALICKSWESAATDTSVSTSRHQPRFTHTLKAPQP